MDGVVVNFCDQAEKPEPDREAQDQYSDQQEAGVGDRFGSPPAAQSQLSVHTIPDRSDRDQQ